MESYFCQPHFQRTGQKIRAMRVIDGTPMCRECFRGKAITSAEDRIALPVEVAKAKGQAAAIFERNDRWSHGWLHSR